MLDGVCDGVCDGVLVTDGVCDGVMVVVTVDVIVLVHLVDCLEGSAKIPSPFVSLHEFDWTK